MKSQSPYNMSVFAEDKTSKTGNSVNAVLKFMSDTIAFNEKLTACIEAQSDPQAKLELAKYSQTIEDLYSTLSTAASTGMRSFKDEAVDQVEDGVEDRIEERVERQPLEPTMVNAPTIPTIPTS